jgi:RNA polymerase sigma factor (sigma-70 family)
MHLNCYHCDLLLVNTDKYQHITETELLQKFAEDGNNFWLGILLQRYTLLLFGVCMKYLKNEEAAKDAVQQIFLKAITELQKYKVDYFKSWLYMVAKNHCLMKLRDKHVFVDVDNVQPMANEEFDIHALQQKEKTLSLIEECLQYLQPDQKTCITLFYLQKKSYVQIVEQTGFTMMQVKSHIQNGKRNLKNLVEKKM